MRLPSLELSPDMLAHRPKWRVVRHSSGNVAPKRNYRDDDALIYLENSAISHLSRESQAFKEIIYGSSAWQKSCVGGFLVRYWRRVVDTHCIRPMMTPVVFRKFCAVGVKEIVGATFHYSIEAW